MYGDIKWGIGMWVGLFNWVDLAPDIPLNVGYVGNPFILSQQQINSYFSRMVQEGILATGPPCSFNLL